LTSPFLKHDPYQLRHIKLYAGATGSFQYRKYVLHLKKILDKRIAALLALAGKGFSGAEKGR
jgi:hypothetical protein